VRAERLADALEWLRRTLDAAGIPFAVIGGLALRHHGYARFTEDIDILTTRDGLERIHKELIGAGLVPRFQGARKGLRETAHAVNVDVITSGEPAGGTGSPVLYPEPGSAAFVERDGFRVPTLPTLVAFKLASGIHGSRSRDIGDVEELIKVNGCAEDLAASLPEPLRAPYLEALTRARRARTLE